MGDYLSSLKDRLLFFGGDSYSFSQCTPSIEVLDLCLWLLGSKYVVWFICKQG